MIAVGTVLHDTYRIDAELGRGGMGCVYAATHTRLPRRVAVKVLTLTTDPQALKRFRREAEICSQIGHDNIVEVHDFNELDGQPYIVMELLTGESLRQRLDREPVLPRPLLVQLVRELGRALAAAHAVGVVHRDLKPENLFLYRVDGKVDGRQGGVERLKVLDFGISKIMGAMSLQTREDALLGTPGYMSPEQARGDTQQVTANADQFSFAAIVYEALSGRPAFMAPDDTPYTVLYKIVHKDPPPLFDEPPPVRAVLARAMAKEPEERFPDISAFAAAMAAALEVPAATARRPSRRRAWIALSLAVAAVGAGVAAREALRVRSRPQRTPAPITPAPITPQPTATAPTPPTPIAPTANGPQPDMQTRATPARDAGAPLRAPKRRGHPAPAAAHEDELSNPYEAKP